MMIGNRKEERRVCTILLHVIRKSPTPTENRLAFFSSELLSKSNPGFKPGLPRQNAIALPLVPPPLPGDQLIPLGLRSWDIIMGGQVVITVDDQE